MLPALEIFIYFMYICHTSTNYRYIYIYIYIYIYNMFVIDIDIFWSLFFIICMFMYTRKYIIITMRFTMSIPGLIWVGCARCFYYSFPEQHPRITQSELAYIIANRDSSSTSQQISSKATVPTRAAFARRVQIASTNDFAASTISCCDSPPRYSLSYLNSSP